MAVPTDFNGSNHVFGAPKGMEDDCDPLNVHMGVDPQGIPLITSCWKLTQAELEEIIRTKRVWLVIWGTGMPPVCVVGLCPLEYKQDPPTFNPEDN